jgi:serine/threonine-protein kinase
MAEPEMPATIGGKYRTIRVVGRGAMGIVYEVEHAHTGQRLALKVLAQAAHADAMAIERFKREARAPSRIKSEHIVRVTDADVAPELGGAPFLVMELLEGADFDDVATGSRPAPADVVGWLRQIARVLDKAHELDIVHRDLKPANLFLADGVDGGPSVVKVLDFGLAKVLSDDRAQTRSGQILGTPLYMSPEQADPDGPPESAQSDLFSLGLIAFRLLVGHDYWRDGSVRQILSQILVEPLPRASERGAALGEAFDAWFEKACARERDERFASGYEMVEALADALGLAREPRAQSGAGSGGGNGSGNRARAVEAIEVAPTLNASVTVTSAPRISQSVPKRTRVAMVAGAAGVLAVGGWFALGRTGRHPPPDPPSASASTSTGAGAATSATAPAPASDPSAERAVAPEVADAGPVAKASAAGSVVPPAAVTRVRIVTPPSASPPRPRPSAGARKTDPLEGQN